MSVDAPVFVRPVKMKPGSRVKVTEVKPDGIDELNEVDIHESEHIAPDPSNVRRATVRPGRWYSGLTELYTYNAIQAAAPHANGRRGTRHDLMTLEAYGHDVNSAVAGAGQVIGRLYRKVLYIAARLHSKGEISGYEAEEAAKEADDPLERLEYEGVNGKIIDFTTRRSQRQAIVHGLVA